MHSPAKTTNAKPVITLIPAFDQEIDLDQARRDMRSRFGFSLELEFERFQQHIIADYSELGYVNLLVREID